MKRAAWLGLGVVLLSNAVALGGVWYNRSGEPEAQLLLSERELQRVYGGWLRDEDDGVLRLQLSWQRPGDGWQLPWLDEAKLRELGFSATDEQTLNRQPARQVWLVLELDGPLYRGQVEEARQALSGAEAELHAKPESEVLQQERDDRQRRLQFVEQQASRLMLVDAGVDAQMLRQRWPDRQRQMCIRDRPSSALKLAPARSRRNANKPHHPGFMATTEGHFDLRLEPCLFVAALPATRQFTIGVRHTQAVILQANGGAITGFCSVAIGLDTPGQ